jgi:hypothetical protein
MLPIPQSRPLELDAFSDVASLFPYRSNVQSLQPEHDLPFRFPNEILLEIIRYHAADRITLASLAGTSKLMNLLTTPYLYSVCVQAKDFAPGGIQPEYKTLRDRTAKFLATLSDRNARHIRRLVLGPDSRTRDVEALSLCNRLESLVFYQVMSRNSWQRRRAHGRLWTVPTLSLRIIDGDPYYARFGIINLDIIELEFKASACRCRFSGTVQRKGYVPVHRDTYTLQTTHSTTYKHISVRRMGQWTRIRAFPNLESLQFNCSSWWSPDHPMLWQHEDDNSERAIVGREFSLATFPALSGRFANRFLNFDQVRGLDRSIPRLGSTWIERVCLTIYRRVSQKAIRLAYLRIRTVPNRLEIVRRTLTWLVCCKRPFALDEPVVAIAIDPGDVDFDDGKEVRSNKHLLELCSSLVKLNPLTDIMELGHFSVTEHLTSATMPNGRENLYCVKKIAGDTKLMKVLLNFGVGSEEIVRRIH